MNQFTYDYVKLKIRYFSNRIPVWEGIFTLENLTKNCFKNFLKFTFQNSFYKIYFLKIVEGVSF